MQPGVMGAHARGKEGGCYLRSVLIKRLFVWSLGFKHHVNHTFRKLFRGNLADIATNGVGGSLIKGVFQR